MKKGYLLLPKGDCKGGSMSIASRGGGGIRQGYDRAQTKHTHASKGKI